MKWFISFFEESPGVNSMSRGILFLAFIFCVMVPSLTWSIGYFIKIRPAISNEMLTFFATIFGAAIAGKTTQSFAEK